MGGGSLHHKIPKFHQNRAGWVGGGGAKNLNTNSRLIEPHFPRFSRSSNNLKQDINMDFTVKARTIKLIYFGFTVLLTGRTCNIGLNEQLLLKP